ncbi:MAG: hypothetical protein H7202_13030 [Pedobacter sp.]|nr:hypothetical protein [Pedobacter sp.]
MKKTIITIALAFIVFAGMSQTKDSVKVAPKVEFNAEQGKQIIEILEESKNALLKSSSPFTTEENLKRIQNLNAIIEEIKKQLKPIK